jgi:hypothetical protein
MPVSEAVDETDAKLKMSDLMENAIRKAFLPHYQTKSFEYENVSTLGVRDRHRDILVEGPDCENWSCIAIAPIPTETHSSGKEKWSKSTRLEFLVVMSTTSIIKDSRTWSL